KQFLGDNIKGTNHLKKHLLRCPKIKSKDISQQMLAITKILQAPLLWLKIIMRYDVFQVHKTENERLYKHFEEYSGRITLWTADHQDIGYICLTSHFIHDNWELEQKYNRLQMVNDAMVRKLKSWLCDKSSISLQGELFHVHCRAHILNLIVQDGLKVIGDFIYKVRETVKYLKRCVLTLAQTDRNYMFHPSDEKWKVAKVICDCLRIFDVATNNFSGSYFPTSNLFFYLRFKMNLVHFYYANVHGSDACNYVEKLYAEDSSQMDSSQEVGDTNNEQGMAFKDDLSSAHKKSELDKYLDASLFPRSEHFHVLNWWKVKSAKLPISSKIARDVLAIPATTVASEAAFSVGGRVIDELHACILPETVEALVTIKVWLPSKTHIKER
ncbi:BED zinc finger, partial [Prunus dulcis]